jgi:hypothetical protein
MSAFNEFDCCPSYYAARRCDQSCFNSNEVVYIAKATVDAHSASNTKLFLRTDSAQGEQFDDEDSRNLCWLIDVTVEYTSLRDSQIIVPNAVSGDFFSGTAINGAEDGIMLEDTNNDDELWYVLCLCYQNDYNLILNDGGATDLVDSDTKRNHFRNKFNGQTNTRGDGCNVQRFVAVNIRDTSIDGSTDHQNNKTDGTPGNSNPLTIGSFVAISGDLKNSSGALQRIETHNTLEATGATDGSSLTDMVAKVIDGPKQNMPGVAYPNGKIWGGRNIDAYIPASGVIKTSAGSGNEQHFADCTTCMQASMGFIDGADKSSLDFEDIFADSDAGYAEAALGDCPSVWPCRVTFDRVYEIDCGKAQNAPESPHPPFSGEAADKIRPLDYDLEISRTKPERDADGDINPDRACENLLCGCIGVDPEDDGNQGGMNGGGSGEGSSFGSAKISTRSFQHQGPIFGTQRTRMTHSVMEQQLGYIKPKDADGTSADPLFDNLDYHNVYPINTLSVSAEYTRGYQDGTQTSPFSTSSCNKFQNGKYPGGFMSYDYVLNSVTVTATYTDGSNPSPWAPICYLARPVTEKRDLPIVHAECADYSIGEAQCGDEPQICSEVDQLFAATENRDPVTLEGRRPLVARDAGVYNTDPEKYTYTDENNNTLTATNREDPANSNPIGNGDDVDNIVVGRIYANRGGQIVPWMRGVYSYCSHGEGAVDTTKLSNNSKSEIIFAADDVNPIDFDEILEFAPMVQFSQGFNVNGFLPKYRQTSRAIFPYSGRPDSGAYPGSTSEASNDQGATDYKVYPTKINQSKITTTVKNTNGLSLKGIAHFFDNVCMGLGVFGLGSEQQRYPNYSGDTGDGAVIESLQWDDTKHDLQGSEEANNQDAWPCENDAVLPCGISCGGSGSGGIQTSLSRSWADHGPFTNPIRRYNGTTTETAGSVINVDFNEPIAQKYRGNGLRFNTPTGLSGDSFESVLIDSEWSSTIVEAADPWCRGCVGCMRTYNPSNTNDNYSLLGDPLDDPRQVDGYQGF